MDNSTPTPGNCRGEKAGERAEEKRLEEAGEERFEERGDARLRGRARERLRRLREERDARRSFRALNFLGELRADVIRQLTEHVLRNRENLRRDMLSGESGAFALQQIEENYLIKLAALERIGVELDGGQNGAPGPTAYEVVEIAAPRRELPQRLLETLAARADSDLLQVLPLRVTEEQSEFLVLFSRPIPPPEIQSNSGDSENAEET